MQILDEDEMDVEALLTQGLWDSWSFGPALVVDGALPERYDTDVSGKNPRTAIGQRAGRQLRRGRGGRPACPATARA